VLEIHYFQRLILVDMGLVKRGPSMFERYTDPAKRIIFFAKIEANHRLEDHISPRDILVGLMRESNSRAMRVAPLQQNVLLLRYLVGIPHLPISSVPYLDNTREVPLDRDAKMVLGYAALEADRDKQYWLDSDHLLRALLRFNNSAEIAAKTIGLNLNALRIASAKDRTDLPPMPAPEWARLRLNWNRWMAWLTEYF
jgi:ATP-dependent Clp protease ATP-binding subunit ClpC